MSAIIAHSCPSNARGEGGIQTLDARNLACPMPIIHAAQALKRLVSGEVLEVICTDPMAEADFNAFSLQTGHSMLRVFEQDGCRHFWLLKK